MSKNDAKQQLSISLSVMLSMEMTRAALRLIEGSDFPWGQVDITAEPVRQGRSLMVLHGAWAYRSYGGFYEYEDATNDEILRTIRIKGYFLGRGGFVEFESKCEIHNYRSMWEPRFVGVTIGGERNFVSRCFYYINKWQGGQYNSTIAE